jgi:hypothetical protein
VRDCRFTATATAATAAVVVVTAVVAVAVAAVVVAVAVAVAALGYFVRCAVDVVLRDACTISCDCKPYMRQRH